MAEPAALSSGEEHAAASEKASKAEADEAAQAAAEANQAGGDGSEASAKAETRQCVPKAGAEPKRAAGEDSISEVVETGRALHFDIAGMTIEIPACTPEADLSVITVSWETEERPISSHVEPKFTRHAATVRMDQPITAAEDMPLLVALHSRRKLTKPGQKFVLAVEHSGACEGRYKRDRLEWGDCSHWKVYDAKYDPARKEMVAEIPATGGYRLQFGWMPK